MIRPWLLAALLFSCSGGEKGDGTESLFDGKTLAGWSGDPSFWTVEEGCLVGRSTAEHPLPKSIYLFHEGPAGDFDLTFEYLIIGGNSGMQYRSERLPDGEVAGYQADIEDGPNYSGILYESTGRGIMAERGAQFRIHSDGRRENGASLGDPAQLQTAVRSGEWNRYRIRAEGARLIHEINGVRMVDVVDEEVGRARSSGVFALQLHQGPPMEARFKNIRMQRLATTVPAAVASAPVAVQKPAPVAEAEWIWSSETVTADERRWFLHSFTLEQPATLVGGAIAVDNHFKAWLDGEEIADGNNWSRPSTVATSKELAAGPHRLAIEAWNEGGQAALVARLLLRGADEEPIVIVSSPAWRWGGMAPPDWPATAAAPQDWSAPISFGPVGAHKGPWGAVMAPRVATPASSFVLQPGFSAELIHSAGMDEGSWVSMTFGPGGEIYVSPQQGKLLRLTFPNGPDAPPQISQLDTPVHSAQGLLYAHDALYAMVASGADGGLHRLRDLDHDGSFEDHAHLAHLGPPGEHGPHGVVLGPEGALYTVIGNHAVEFPAVAETSPFRNWAEDVLLERLWDPRGHAVGVMAPGGIVLRTDPDGQKWELFYGGMRNAYDISFAPNGELFSYDSDMEWDFGAPWYRAPRVVHVVPGGDNGWRSGSANPGSAYPDNLPPALDTGPASPTGTVFGTLGNFPGAWREAFYIADWAYGRIHAVHFIQDGASYVARSDTFISGKPMNVADLEFGPDGALWFVTGGRGTQSGLYRVRWTGGATPPPARQTFARSSAELLLRRKLEAPECPLADALPALGHADRFVRTAARNLLERHPPEQWRTAALTAAQPLARGEGWLALARVDGAHSAPAVAKAIAALDFRAASLEVRWLAVRGAMLLLTRAPEQRAALTSVLLPAATKWLPSGDTLLNREVAGFLVAIEAPGLPARLIEFLRAAEYDEERIHYALLLRLVKTDWTREQRVEVLTWVRTARNLPGGYSLGGFLEAIERETLASMPPEEAEAVRALLPPPSPTPAFAAPENRPFVQTWSLAGARGKLDSVSGAPDLERGARLFRALGCIQCHRIGPEGGSIGPDLTTAGNRFSRQDLLEAIIEPQKIVSDQFPLIPMPAGLADTLKTAELRDLVAWLESKTVQ
jgi:mono/diheme cytochrome c family protein